MHLKISSFLLMLFLLEILFTSAIAHSNESVLSTVVSDVCEKEIVLLGENGFHGEAKTHVFKVALVQELVTECGFDAVFFESSFYDFLELQMRVDNEDPVELEMLSSSIGGIWNKNAEIAPLISFLYTHSLERKVKLGGLDFQLGSAGAFYSLREMPRDLAARLSNGRRGQCESKLRRYIWSDYSDTLPYDNEERTALLSCLAEIEAAIDGLPFAERYPLRAVVANFRWVIDTDHSSREEFIVIRDEVMFRNFEWLLKKLPEKSKVIVWSANTHIARDAHLVDPYGNGDNLGAHIVSAYNNAVYSLGFSASSGEHGRIGFSSQPIPLPKSETIEALATKGKEIAYIRKQELNLLGKKLGGFFEHKFVENNWDTSFDGVVIFAVERPPSSAIE